MPIAPRNLTQTPSKPALERLAEISGHDIADAKRSWRDQAPSDFRELLDAGVALQRESVALQQTKQTRRR